MEVYLIRHTTPAVEKGICYGQTDLLADELLFEKEVEDILKKLPKQFDKVYSSPLQRCSILAEKLSNDPVFDNRLMELNFGDWENKSWDKIDPKSLSVWMPDFVNVKAGGAESYLELYQRIVSFIEELQTTDYKNVIIITHAGCIRSFISFVLDLPLENSFRIALGYGEVIRISLAGESCNNKLYLTTNCHG
jgi:alpha-ribazole phosphatase